MSDDQGPTFWISFRWPSGVTLVLDLKSVTFGDSQNLNEQWCRIESAVTDYGGWRFYSRLKRNTDFSRKYVTLFMREIKVEYKIYKFNIQNFELKLLKFEHN